MSYNESAKAYQRSLDTLRASLKASGLSANEVTEQSNKALHDGKIPSAAAVISNYRQEKRLKQKEEFLNPSPPKTPEPSLADVQKRMALEAQKDTSIDSATASYIAMGQAVENGEFSKEEYDKAQEEAGENQPKNKKYQGDILTDIEEARMRDDIIRSVSVGGEGTRDEWTKLEVKRANEGVSWNMEETLETRKRIRDGANEIEDEKKIDTTYRGDVLADYNEGRDWSEAAFASGVPGSIGTQDEWTRLEIKRAKEGIVWEMPKKEKTPWWEEIDEKIRNFAQHPPTWLSVSYQPDIPFSTKNFFTGEVISYQRWAKGWEILRSIGYQKTTIDVGTKTKITSNPSGRVNFNFSNGRISFKGLKDQTGTSKDWFIQPLALSFGNKVNYADNTFDSTTIDFDLLGKNWASFTVSLGTGHDHTEVIQTLDGEFAKTITNFGEFEVSVHRYLRVLIVAIGIVVVFKVGVALAPVIIPLITILERAGHLLRNLSWSVSLP